MSTPRETRRRRPRLGWVVVALAGTLVAASFALRAGGGAGPRANRAPRVTPVAAEAVARGPLTERVRYPGELDADATDVAAFYAGRLIAVRVRVGDRVKAGEVVAELDPVDAREQIAQARAQARAAFAERARAQVERDAAAAELARIEPLSKGQLISALEIDRARARADAATAAVDAAAASAAEARARVRLLEKRVVESAVRAPFAGRVAARYVDPGAIVAAGAPLVRVVQIAPLRLRFEVPEREVARLGEGTRLRVVTQAAAPAGRAGDGPVAATGGAPAVLTGVASEIDRERRVASLEALIERPPAGWLPGMYAEAIVDVRTIPQATLVPARALLTRLQPDGRLQPGVLVADDGVARWTPVTVAAREGDRVAVDGPVAADARVLVSGHADLPDGSPIELVEEAPRRPEGG